MRAYKGLGVVLNRSRLGITKRFNRFFYDHVYYSPWLTKNLKFFNLGLVPIDPEIAAADFIGAEKPQAQVYFEAIKAYKRHAPSAHPEKVLEVSVGLGGGLVLLAQQLPKARLYGLDYSQTSAKRTRQQLKTAQLVVADAHLTPFTDNSFALVVNVESLHAFKPEVFFKEIKRLLRDDGLFVVVDFRKIPVVELHRYLRQEAEAAQLQVVEFVDLTQRALAASLQDSARRQLLSRRVPPPFKKWVNEMTAAEGSELRKQYETGEKTYFLCVIKPVISAPCAD